MTGIAEAWYLVSQGPARMLGLEDRGVLETGKRADLVILERETHRVAATLSAGRISYMAGNVASRFIDR
jgi:alpha-D-ribose 1-methylphosphonate 5-triphosphate diphosphatase